MNRMLCLALFGSMTARLESPAEPTRICVLAPQLGELLAFLAVRRGCYFERADIAENLWAQDEGETRIGTVNTALWRLRRVIESTPARRGDFLVIDRRGAVGLNGPHPVNLDVAEFEQLTRNGLNRPLEALKESDEKGLRTAVALYRDDVLAEFRGTWALRERERLRNIFLNAAGRLMQLAERLGQYEDAIGYARAVLEVDSLREDMHRDLMRYLVLGGQRALALRQFEICRAALQRELAIPPMPETLALYRQIAAAALEHRPSASPYPPGSCSAPPTTATNAEPTASSRPPRTLPGAATHVEHARCLMAEADEHLRQTLESLRRE
jgi:two-component SAPR family response regulator